LHSLPLGVPPETLAAAERIQYANGLDAAGEIPLSTYGRYFTEAPKQNAVRATPPGAGTRFVLPRHSSAPGDDVNLPGAGGGSAGYRSPLFLGTRPR